MTDAAVTAPQRLLTLEDLLETRTFADGRAVALSPDGRYAAYATQRSGDLCHRRDAPLQSVPVNWEACRLTALDTEDGTAVPLLPEAFSAWTPSWSPAGGRLAFLAAERRDAPVALWLWQPGAGPARRATDRAVHPHAMPRWFPDGRRLCVALVPPDGGVPPRPTPTGVAVFESPAPETAGALQGPWCWADLAAVDAETGAVDALVEGRRAQQGFPSPAGGHLLWAEAGVRLDPAQFVFRNALHLWRADGWRGAVGAVDTGVDWNHWHPRWSPDGTRFCAQEDGAVAIWDVARPDAPPARRTLPGGVRATGWLAWTADGSGIAVVADGRLWLCPVAGAGEAAWQLCAPRRALSGLVQRRASDSLPPGDAVILAQGDVRRLPLDGSEAVTVAEGLGETWGFGPRSDGMGDATPDGRRFVYAVGGPYRPADLWLAWDGGRQRRRLTDLNPHLRGVAKGTRHRFPFRTADGVEAGATVLTPPGWRIGEPPCPTVVSFYPGRRPSGNPGSAVSALEPELLAAQGYAVLLPDVLYDHRSAADPIEAAPAAVLPAVEEAVRLGFADPERLAVMGASFGGMAVIALLTRTSRFRAAVAVAGAANLAAKYGQMHLALQHPEWIGTAANMESGQGGMGGAPWERPLRYVANSPVFFLDRVTTPLLLVAGSQDSAVAWTQSGEVFAGLRRLGRTCTLLVGRGEGHAVSHWSEPNRREAVAGILEWLRRHLTTG